jgi:poly [ADP-ribose] polymerase 2/3/4
MARQIELIMVSSSNNNKYYKMFEEGSNFTVKYGRVGLTEQTMTYPISDWDKKYNEKIKKGYKDITSLKATIKSTVLKDVTDPIIMKLLSDLQGYSKQSILDNYTVSSEQVTYAQLDKAQIILNEIAEMLKKKTISNPLVDDKLTELYTVIPRKMKKVQDFILNGTGDKAKAKAILEREQDAIDVMKGQVSINQASSDDSDKTLEDVLGVKISKVSDDDIIQKVKDMMGTESDKFKALFEVVHKSSRDRFEKQKKESVKHWTKLLWHGSRNENWLNILKTSLVLHPTNAVISGKMFGMGCYFADKCKKALGYTSLRGSYWAKGNASQAFMALYEVNTGMEYRVDKHTSEMYSMSYKNLKAKGEYDSLFAKGGIDLVNNEYIVYKAEQVTIKYLVELN